MRNKKAEIMKKKRAKGIYERYVKRPMDFFLSLSALIVLSPLLLILTVIGAFAMKGNPFFVQPRPGLNEKIFKLVKFRTMSNEKDKDGNLLSDEKRLNKYGKFLRSTSLDELPELWNILKGDLAIIGPRPLLPRDVAYMNDEQHRRHTVRPGLTGLAQCSGRNGLNWDDKLTTDIKYVDNISFRMDSYVFIQTIYKVLKRENVAFEDGSDIDLKDWNELKKKKENHDGITSIYS